MTLLYALANQRKDGICKRSIGELSARRHDFVENSALSVSYQLINQFINYLNLD